jgi:hypothetical protein
MDQELPVGSGEPDEAEVVVEHASALKPACSAQKYSKRSTAATGTTTSSFVFTAAPLGDADLTSIERSFQRSLVLNHQ